jgi:hypothetical protein
MKVKVNKLGVTEPQTLYLCYNAPNNAPIAQETIDMAKTADVARLDTPGERPLFSRQLPTPMQSFPFRRFGQA